MEADVVGGSRVDEAVRLLAVDRLVQMAVKKGVLHVQLMDRPGARSGDAEDDPDGGRFDNRAERLVVVDAVPLRKTTNDPPGLMASQGAVSTILVLEDPLAGDHISAQGARHEIPSVVLQKGSMFLFHSSAPVWVGKRATEGLGHWTQLGGGEERRYSETALRARGHGVLVAHWWDSNSTRRQGRSRTGGRRGRHARGWRRGGCRGWALPASVHLLEEVARARRGRRDRLVRRCRRGRGRRSAGRR